MESPQFGFMPASLPKTDFAAGKFGGTGSWYLVLGRDNAAESALS
jgi:hypothetical protein